MKTGIIALLDLCTPGKNMCTPPGFGIGPRPNKYIPHQSLRERNRRITQQKDTIANV